MRVPNWIGDAVLCEPALRALKGLYPSAEIIALAKPRVAPVFENNPVLSGIMVYDVESTHAGYGGLLRLSRRLRAEKFDMAVLFQNAFEAALIAYLARIPERIGYARDLRTPLLTGRVELTGEIKKEHQVFYYLNIIKELGGKTPVLSPYPPTCAEKEIFPEIRLRDAEIRGAQGFLENKGFGGGEFLFGVSPGASYGPAKRWGVGGFREVIERLSKDTDSAAVIFGGKDDEEVCRELSGNLKVRHLNLAGRTSLREFIALAARMRFFITNDSGPMHVAAALGVPTVAIFGSTEPMMTGPLGKRTEVIRKKVECSPCFKKECPYGHYKCMSAINPDEVYAASRAFFTEAA
ncbi:MAG: lipopolysaccharide heptosyltransferase II [Deltaproteobacteria bacterium]|nr:lipopolysaccharide heptosyltransferase II [Deltaproteobacteria bacterium]